MTDNEIIKALEYCASANINSCDDCPFDKRCQAGENLCKHVLDLINRQTAEIERLKSLERNVYETVKKLKNKIESEARKEFAERLKGMSEYGTIYLSPWQVDNLVEEMERENDCF